MVDQCEVAEAKFVDRGEQQLVERFHIRTVGETSEETVGQSAGASMLIGVPHRVLGQSISPVVIRRASEELIDVTNQ